MAKAKSASASMVSTSKSPAKKTDLIASIASEVEVLTKPKAFALVDQTLARGGEDDFRLGGVLAVIYDKSTAEGGDEWLDGHDSFKTLVSARFGVEYRKAMYLISIYKALVENQIPWAAVKDIGWSKLAILASVLTSKNAGSWADKAKKCNIEELKEHVKKAKAKGDGGNATSDEATVKRVTVVLHEDQVGIYDEAIEKAKKESKTDFDTVALVNICQAYLGNAITMEFDKPDAGKKGKKELSARDQLKTLMEKVGYEQALTVFDKTFDGFFIKIKTPESIEEEKAEAKKLGIKKYDPETFEVDKALAETTK